MPMEFINQNVLLIGLVVVSGLSLAKISASIWGMRLSIVIIV